MVLKRWRVVVLKRGRVMGIEEREGGVVSVRRRWQYHEKMMMS